MEQPKKPDEVGQRVICTSYGDAVTKLMVGSRGHVDRFNRNGKPVISITEGSNNYDGLKVTDRCGCFKRIDDNGALITEEIELPGYAEHAAERDAQWEAIKAHKANMVKAHRANTARAAGTSLSDTADMIAEVLAVDPEKIRTSGLQDIVLGHAQARRLVVLAAKAKEAGL